MVKLLISMFVISFLLALSQVFLKFGLNKISNVSFGYLVLVSIVKSVYFWLTALTTVIAGVIWIFVLWKYDFSTAYPLISISYIFGLLAAVFIFNETVPMVRWAGVCVILLGIFLVTKS